MIAANDNEITVEALERGLDRLALAMQRAPKSGEVYLALFERIEREIEIKKAGESTMSRALRRVRR
jgi:hypothetical protein